MSKKYGFAVYSSMLGGVLGVYNSLEDAKQFIADYYREYGNVERLTVINNYPF